MKTYYGRGPTHEIMVLCNCDDIECCQLEVYVSDVRILEAELRVLLGRAAELAPEAE